MLNGPELKVFRYVNNAPGDGKDDCDLSGSHAKDKVMKEVNSLQCNADNPRNFANAIVRGNGMKNTVVMLGTIVGSQATLKEKEKKIKAITKIHDFEFIEEGPTMIKQCS